MALGVGRLGSWLPDSLGLKAAYLLLGNPWVPCNRLPVSALNPMSPEAWPWNQPPALNVEHPKVSGADGRATEKPHTHPQRQTTMVVPVLPVRTLSQYCLNVFLTQHIPKSYHGRLFSNTQGRNADLVPPKTALIGKTRFPKASFHPPLTQAHQAFKNPF